MKKVLLYTRPIVPPWDEASKNLAYDIARTHSSDELEFHVLSTKDSQFQLENSHGKNVVTEKVYSSGHLGTKEKLELLGRLYKLDIAADVIHFLFTPRSLTSALIKSRLSFSKVKTVQTIATVSDELFTNPKVLKNIFFADVIVAQSQTTQKKLLSAGFKNVKMIYPGIDLKKFAPAEKDQALLKELGLKTTDTIFLFAGELTRLRGIDDIIEAFRLIKESEPDKFEDIKLLIACRIKSSKDEAKRKEIEKTVVKLGLDKNIIFYNSVKDMPTLYNLSGAQIFFVQEMTGKVDIPYVLIESMACQKPLIVSDFPFLKEIVKDNINGFVVSKDNVDALAERILHLAFDQEKTLFFGTKCRQIVAENFDIDKNVRLYERVYQTL